MIALALMVLRLVIAPTLHGSIRASDDSAPLAAALIEVFPAETARGYRRAYTDSTGGFSFQQLAPGAYHLRVSRMGYEARALEVFISGESPVEVDVTLRVEPERLADVRVVGATNGGADGDSAFARIAARDVGSVTLAGNALHDDPALASADVLQSISIRGVASMRDEVPTSMHVHGAAADENAVLLDGVPLFNPYHATGTLAALDPDIIQSATLHAVAPGAQFGDATGSVIELVTVPPSDSFTTRGGYTGRAIRESVAAPLPLIAGNFLVAARVDEPASLSDSRDPGGSGVSFHDIFARAGIPFRGGDLEAFAFHSRDQIAFDALAEHPSLTNDGPNVSTPNPPMANALSWTTGTDALRWRSAGNTPWEVRAWRTRFDADFQWDGATSLHSSYRQLGLSASTSWYIRALEIESGVDVRNENVSYAVSQRSDTSATMLALHGTPFLVSAFSEVKWTMSNRWSAALGLRDPVIAPAGHGLEPRMSVRFAPARGISLGVGYSRLHQYVQSLRNEESVLDALAGITLPVVAGSSANGLTVPVARADQLALSLDARLSSTMALSAVAYTRFEDGLTLVAPVSSAPIATSTFATGSAHARGMSLALERSGDRISGELAYSLSSISRTSPSGAYTPSFAATHVLALGLGARVFPSTTLRFAASLNSGMPASIYADPIEWRPYTPASGNGDIAGSPQRLVGAVDGARLPSYVRFDVGVRRLWSVSLFGVGASVAGSAAITNVLGRANALGLTAQEGNAVHPLLLPARALTLGMEWQH